MFKNVNWRIVLIAVILLLSIAVFNIFVIKSTKNVLNSKGEIVKFPNPMNYPITKTLEPLQEKNWIYDIVWLGTAGLLILIFLYDEEHSVKPFPRSYLNVIKDTPRDFLDAFEFPVYNGKIDLEKCVIGFTWVYNHYLVKMKDKLGKMSWIVYYGMSDVGKSGKPEQVIDSYWNDDDIHQKHIFKFLHKERRKRDVDKSLEKLKEYDLKKAQDKKLQQLEENEEDEED